MFLIEQNNQTFFIFFSDLGYYTTYTQKSDSWNTYDDLITTIKTHKNVKNKISNLIFYTIFMNIKII